MRGDFLTSTVDIVGRWKGYFKELFYPVGTPFTEAIDTGDSEEDSTITQAKVTVVVSKLLGVRASGADEICPEYLKSLDVLGLSWLTCLCNIVWQSKTVPLKW